MVISIKEKQYIAIKYNIFNSEYEFIILYNIFSPHSIEKLIWKIQNLRIVYFRIEIETEMTISIPVIIVGFIKK